MRPTRNWRQKYFRANCTSARQACKGDLRGVHLTAAEDTLLEYISIGWTKIPVPTWIEE